MVKTTIVCDKCGSERVITAGTSEANVEYGTVLDTDSLRTRTVKKSYDEIRIYECRSCGNVFKENLGTHNYRLDFYEIFKN